MNKNNKILSELPSTLVFNKKGVQNFPNNQKVALYYCESLKKYFSIAYNKSGLELMESDNSFIEKLRILEEVEPIYFEDGSSLNIDKDCAQSIIDVYDSLSEEQQEFEEFILESEKNFLSILKYSVKNKEKLNG